MPLHQNILGFPGDVYSLYSLYDNLWIYTGGGLFIAPRTGWYLVTGCGGGAGGGGGVGAVGGGGSGGGAGALVWRRAIWMYAGETFNVTIGARGIGVITADGTAGGSTSLGSILILGGGIKGLKSVGSLVAGGLSGAITGTRTGSMRSSYNNGSVTSENMSAQRGTDGTLYIGGGGGGPGFSIPGSILDILLFGGEGTPGADQATASTNGNSGDGYGVGGGGAFTIGPNRTGGDGTPGILFIEMAP